MLPPIGTRTDRRRAGTERSGAARGCKTPGAAGKGTSRRPGVARPTAAAGDPAGHRRAWAGVLAPGKNSVGTPRGRSGAVHVVVERGQETSGLGSRSLPWERLGRVNLTGSDPAGAYPCGRAVSPDDTALRRRSRCWAHRARRRGIPRDGAWIAPIEGGW